MNKPVLTRIVIFYKMIEKVLSRNLIPHSDIIVMIFIITFLLVLHTSTKNPLNYQFDYLQTIDLGPMLGSQSISNIQYPNKDVIIAKTNTSIKFINPNELYFNSSITVNSSKSVFFGSERTIVFDSSSAYGINSYYKPKVSFPNLLSNKAKMRTIAAFQDKFWILNTFNSYIQQYSNQNGVMKLFDGSLPQSHQLLFTIDLIYDQLLVYQGYVYVYNHYSTSSSKYYIISTGNFEDNFQCYKTYEQISSDNTIVNQFLAIKSEEVIILYKRTIKLSQQGITKQISSFEEFNRFQDLSYSCNFNIKNSSQITIFTPKSRIIQRSLITPDQYIGSKNSSPGKNSIKAQNTHNIFYNTTHKFTIYTDTYQTHIQSFNANISANHLKKVFEYNSYVIYYANNTITMVNKQSGFAKVFLNVSNCQLVGEILYIMRESNKSIKISTYNILKLPSEQKVCGVDLSGTNDYIFNQVYINETRKGLMLVRQIQDSLIKKMILFYDYDKQQAFVLDGSSHSSQSINIIFLPCIPTIYAQVIQISQEKLNFKFYSLDHTLIATRNVPAYQTIRVSHNAFIVFNANHNDSTIFYYQIKGDKIQFPDLEQKVYFSKLSSQIQSNNILFFKDQHTQGNYIVYAYSPQNTAFVYNTLNPIKSERSLKYFSFSSDSQLLIKPQTYGRNIYYVFKNYTFVHLQLQDISGDNSLISQQSNDSTQFLKNCQKITMKITPLKNIQTQISFLCVTSRNNNYILYSAISQALKPIKNFLQVKGTVKDYTFNQKNEIGVTTQIGGYSNFNYYQSIYGYQTINFNLSKRVCFSNNGQNVVLSNGPNSSLVVNFQTGKSYPILAEILMCAINDKGQEVVHYKQGVTQIFIQGQLWHRFYQVQSVKKIMFLGDNIIMSLQSHMIGYRSILQLKQGNINRVLNFSGQSIYSINGNTLLFFIKDTLSYQGINICPIDSICYNPVTFVYKMSQDLIRVTYQGNLAVFVSSEPTKLIIYTPSLKSCDSDQYRINGQCQKCFDHCDSCQQETGFCNQCTNPEPCIWTLFSIAVVQAFIIFVMSYIAKRKKKKTEDKKRIKEVKDQKRTKKIEDQIPKKKKVKDQANQVNQSLIEQNDNQHLIRQNSESQINDSRSISQYQQKVYRIPSQSSEPLSQKPRINKRRSKKNSSSIVP